MCLTCYTSSFLLLSCHDQYLLHPAFALEWKPLCNPFPVPNEQHPHQAATYSKDQIRLTTRIGQASAELVVCAFARLHVAAAWPFNN